MTKPKLVYVEWNDAHSSDKWQTVLEARLNMTEMMNCKTIGYQISKTKEFIVVANTIAWDNTEAVQPMICGVFHIPMKRITHMKEIKLY